MLRLDESFLKNVGLGDMLAEEKGPFLKYVQEQLEMRIGERMAEGMSAAQVEEFERLAEGDETERAKFLAAEGNYQGDSIYLRMVEKGGFADGADETLNEYVLMKWMMKNQPNYKGIVEEVMGEIKKDIESNKSSISAVA